MYVVSVQVKLEKVGEQLWVIRTYKRYLGVKSVFKKSLVDKNNLICISRM
jgi:hypothetical protein